MCQVLLQYHIYWLLEVGIIFSFTDSKKSGFREVKNCLRSLRQPHFHIVSPFRNVLKNFSLLW